MHSHINFDYSWYWVYGHLIFTAVFLPLLLLALFRKWPKVLVVLLGAVTLWSIAAFLVVQFGMNMNSRTPLPTEAFLPSGGHVLDMGAGTGRATLMILEARPRATVVALDSFGESYVEHFGKAAGGGQVVDQGRTRLLENLSAAGVEQRAIILPGDMRQMPVESASFDGVVSSYAIDHLGRDGRSKALSEAMRALKPGGQFLLMVIDKDVWFNLAWGPLMLHHGLPGHERWAGFLRDAGFQITESGRHPATLYFLARKP